jgi:uncharacterized membrane protein YhaH (DUF805 family)
MSVFMLWLISAVFRRLHDMGRQASHAVWFVVPIANVVFVLELMLKAGDLGSNQFGPSPKVRLAD